MFGFPIRRVVKIVCKLLYGTVNRTNGTGKVPTDTAGRVRDQFLGQLADLHGCSVGCAFRSAFRAATFETIGIWH